ncbi:G-protein coupled receptor 87-like [Chiloscyllium punctatum]|uniref:G-protein coupled receptor 87-like n=1 Tax=Chiloscyllium punctatum TaxID=137246 RepID=UPI003B634CFC
MDAQPSHNEEYNSKRSLQGFRIKKMNTTHDTTSNHTFCSRDSKIAEVVYPILYSIIFIISFTLNSLAIWIFFKIKKTRSFDFYLKNLAMSDLLMTLTYPFKILSKSDLAPWQLTWFACRYSEVIFYLSMYASILFLSLISLDRCLKIVKPFRNSKLHDINRARMFSAGVWLLVLALGVPNSILTNKKATAENVKHCNSLKSPFGKHWHEAVIYICTGVFFIGFLILVVCYIFIMKEILKSKKTFSTATNKNYKMNQNIAWVVAVFFICFVPYHLWRLSFTAGQMHGNFSCSVESVRFHGREFTLFLAACNGSLDPIIYFFMSKSFQETLSYQGRWKDLQQQQ